MFIDASAIVAILQREPHFKALVDRLEKTSSAMTSAIAIFESTLAISRLGTIPTTEAEEKVRSFLAASEIAIVPIDGRDASHAIFAHHRYGKGRGHPARLNLGDCFAYACAQTRVVPLLFIGNDFSQTDIPSALA
ncbi:twitching motility protein PilT [Methylobacterium sp. Leaf87]|uniref:type II toxin-antitoxin system VapC family toxin n=1 Tax=Methylobacterium sp. Leaf87 TaxID=1736243 RepID=UPI0006F984C8|nr:type II toxin-antitoxin system VapC family toxin [Methylobacterium sp. Leaf87]KQO69806.1 twitching motility protein PilT [Methylobacterium sp. Leaf87]